MSRRIPGWGGHRAAKAKLAQLDRRAVYIRQDAWHKLTSWLSATYGEVVVEDLNIAAMNKSMERRAFRRSVSDATLGMFRPMLTYKMDRIGSALTVTDRFFASSQVHHGCRCRLTQRHKMDKMLVCLVTYEPVDRGINASLNLRDWPESNASPGLVEDGALVDTQAAGEGGTDPSLDGKMTRRAEERQ